MLLHNLELFIRQRGRLLQNLVVNSDLADIMQDRADSDLLNLIFRQIQPLRDGDGKT